MNIEFLRRLFTSCSEETGNGYRDGLNLSELYYRIEEVAEVERQFSEVRSGAGLSPSVEDSISAAAYAVIRAYEMQGFINGFRLCAQLGKELSGMERNTNESDKYMAVIQRIAGLASPRQIRFLEKRGFVHVERWSFETAKNMIDQIAANGWRVPEDIVPQEYETEGTEAAV